MLTVTLPLPPSDNNCYPTTRGGRRVLSRAAKAWKEKAALKIWNAASWARWDVPEGPLALKLTVHFGPRHRRQDAMNRQKLATDTAAAALGFDDSRFHLVIVERGEDRPEAELEMVIAAAAVLKQQEE